jgi:hypothetical protein
VTTFNGDTAEGALHAGVGNADDSLRQLLNAGKASVRNNRESLTCAGFVESHGTAEKVIWMKPAKKEVGVGDGC